jgi:hypothetical protein
MGLFIGPTTQAYFQPVSLASDPDVLVIGSGPCEPLGAPLQQGETNFKKHRTAVSAARQHPVRSGTHSQVV